MILTCPQCATRYEVDASKFGAAARTVRCAKCGHSWRQEPEAAPQAEPVIAAAAAQAPVSAPEPEPEPDIAVSEGADAAATEPQARPQAYAPRADIPRPISRATAAGREPNWSHRAGLIGGWIGLVVVMLLIGGAAVSFRQEIARVWPQSASFYSRLGLPVNTSGISLTATYRIETEDNVPVLAVSGRLVNISAHDIPVPQIRVALTDKDRHEIYHWVFVPNVMTLKPGQVEPFLTRLASPPPAARHLEVRVVRAGE